MIINLMAKFNKYIKSFIYLFIVKKAKRFFYNAASILKKFKLIRKKNFGIAKDKKLVGNAYEAQQELIINPEVVKDVNYVFNPTFINNKNSFTLLARTVDAQGLRSNAVIKLSQELEVKEVMLSDLGKLGEVDWVADCRYFKYQGYHYVTFNTGHSQSPNEIFIQKIDDEFQKKSEPIICKKDKTRKRIEKNWGFFEFENRLYCVYSISPFVILEATMNDDSCDLSEIIRYGWDSSDYEKKYGELRGGASPFLYDGIFYYIVQSNAFNVFGKIYSSTIISFDPKHEFKPIAISKEPLFRLSYDEYSDIPKRMLNESVEACLYPTGAAVMNDYLLISYGVNDYKASFKKYLLKDILSGIDNYLKVEHVGR